jgi:signal transduction histidine kinase
MEHNAAGPSVWLKFGTISLVTLGSLLVMVIGGLAIYGWYSQTPLFIQIDQGLAPMQFNTALCLILIAGGQLLALCRLNKASAALGIIAALIGLLTLLEYLFSIDLYIDQLFFEPYIFDATSHPGRMAPNTALAFVLAGSTLICPQLNLRPMLKANGTSLFLFSVLLISMLAFISYISNYYTLSYWGVPAHMAWHTATAFIFWGISQILLHHYQRRKHNSQHSVTSPLVAFIVSFLIFTFLWKVAVYNESEHIHAHIKSSSQTLYQTLRQQINQPLSQIIKTAQTQLNGIKKHPAQFTLDIHHKPLILSANYYNAKQNRLFTLRTQDLQKQSRALSLGPVIQQIINHSHQAWHSHLVPLYSYSKKQELFFLTIPHYQEQNYQGVLLLQMDLAQLFKHALANSQPKGFHVRFSGPNNQIIFQSKNDPQHSIILKKWQSLYTFSLINQQITLTVCPDMNYIMSRYTLTPVLILLFGIGFSSLIARLIYTSSKLKEQRQLMASASEETKAISYFISHDLRAPLRHINGFIDILLKNPNITSDTEAQRKLQVIQKSAYRMRELIDGLLSLSRLSRHSIQPKWVDMHALTSNVIEEFSLQQQKSHSSIQWELENLSKAYGDSKLLLQVMQNLIENAIKFSQHKTPPRIRISMTGTTQGQTLCVQDNGAGFDNAQAKHIFNLFTRLHDEESFPGTGIGLANVKKIIEMHKGKCWATSNKGLGSRIYIYLPNPKKR